MGEPRIISLEPNGTKICMGINGKIFIIKPDDSRTDSEDGSVPSFAQKMREGYKQDCELAEAELARFCKALVEKKTENAENPTDELEDECEALRRGIKIVRKRIKKLEKKMAKYCDE